MRWLDIELIPFDEFSDDENDLNDPRLFIVLGQGNEKRAAVLKKINAKIKSAPYPVVVSYPKHSEILSKNILRLFSLKELRKENQILQLDKVARRYVDEEMNYLESVIEDGIEQSLSEADWHFSRDNKTLAPQVIDASTLNAAISSLFDHYYPNAPIIKNELANKNFPSPNANSAIRILMNRCIENQDEANLGLPIDKMPPEKTIYNAVISNFGLHRERALNEFSLEAPQKDGKGDALAVMWMEALKILKKKSVTAVEIMSIWEMPPFGVKRGLMPLLLLLFYLTNRKNVALYFENIFQTEINEMTSEFLIRVAKDFSFKYVDYDASVNTYSWMAKTIRDELELTHPVEPTSLGVGRALVTYQKNTCPKFTQSTRSLSETSMLLRNELNRSHDPLVLVDEKLASNFKEPKTLRKALREIKTCYPKRIESFKKIFIEELKLSDAANPGEEIREKSKISKW